MRTIIFPIVQVQVFGWPDSVQASEHDVEQLQKLKNGVYVPRNAMKRLVDKKLATSFSISQMGEAVLEAIKDGASETIEIK